MKSIQRFQIKGLFGNRNIDISPGEGAMILVGPNGIGKSSVVNILYFFITRQWARLLEYKFDEVIIHVDGENVSAKREEISGLLDLGKVISEMPVSSRPRMLLDRLNATNLLEEFAATPTLTPQLRKRFSDALRIPTTEVANLHRFAFRRFSLDESPMKGPRVSIEKALTRLFPSRTLYLPTYRRIEKDLREIFPDFEERYRSHTSTDSLLTLGRSSSHYIDLVSFGMEDVKLNFRKKTREMRDYSLEQYNSLSGTYLRDVIRGKADQFTSKQINDLTNDSISSILDRVNEQTLPPSDKDLLRKKILALQGKKKIDIEIHDRYLAHYFNRLVSANVDIAYHESEIVSFVDVCNAYLNPTKRMVYDEINFTIEILDSGGNALDLSVLSSGEKQVVSLFSHLYLDDSEGQIVVIDEPELSLSVPWQKRFLTDILNSRKCDFIVAVTHSPFIYENSLKKSAFDLRRKTEMVIPG